MYNVNVSIVDQIVKIVILSDSLAKTFFSKIGSRCEMIAVDITKSHKTAGLVTVEMIG